MTYPNFKQEKSIWQTHRLPTGQAGLPIFALDEAGRGSLAGPVTVCALTIKKSSDLKTLKRLKIKDSKQLSPLQREKLYAWLYRNPQFEFVSASCSAKVIDKVNIRRANFRAMRQAIKKLARQTGSKKFVVLVDGKEKIPHLKQSQYSFVKGDEKVFSLACASIVAKVRRDRLLKSLAKQYPAYKLDQHKGYGTREHFRLLKKYGPAKIHRKTFLKKLK